MKMTTGGEEESRAAGKEGEALGSDSSCVPFAQVMDCCLRWCRPFW